MEFYNRILFILVRRIGANLKHGNSNLKHIKQIINNQWGDPNADYEGKTLLDIVTDAKNEKLIEELRQLGTNRLLARPGDFLAAGYAKVFETLDLGGSSLRVDELEKYFSRGGRQDYCPNLQRLDVSGCLNVTSQSLVNVVREVHPRDTLKVLVLDDDTIKANGGNPGFRANISTGFWVNSSPTNSMSVLKNWEENRKKQLEACYLQKLPIVEEEVQLQKEPINVSPENRVGGENVDSAYRYTYKLNKVEVIAKYSSGHRTCIYFRGGQGVHCRCSEIRSPWINWYRIYFQSREITDVVCSLGRIGLPDDFGLGVADFRTILAYQSTRPAGLNEYKCNQADFTCYVGEIMTGNQAIRSFELRNTEFFYGDAGRFLSPSEHLDLKGVTSFSAFLKMLTSLTNLRYLKIKNVVLTDQQFYELFLAIQENLINLQELYLEGLPNLNNCWSEVYGQARRIYNNFIDSHERYRPLPLPQWVAKNESGIGVSYYFGKEAVRALARCVLALPNLQVVLVDQLGEQCEAFRDAIKGHKKLLEVQTLPDSVESEDALAVEQPPLFAKNQKTVLRTYGLTPADMSMVWAEPKVSEQPVDQLIAEVKQDVADGLLGRNVALTRQLDQTRSITALREGLVDPAKKFMEAMQARHKQEKTDLGDRKTQLWIDLSDDHETELKTEPEYQELLAREESLGKRHQEEMLNVLAVLQALRPESALWQFANNYVRVATARLLTCAYQYTAPAGAQAEDDVLWERNWQVIETVFEAVTKANADYKIDAPFIQGAMRIFSESIYFMVVLPALDKSNLKPLEKVLSLKWQSGKIFKSVDNTFKCLAGYGEQFKKVAANQVAIWIADLLNGNVSLGDVPLEHVIMARFDRLEAGMKEGFTQIKRGMAQLIGQMNTLDGRIMTLTDLVKELRNRVEEQTDTVIKAFREGKQQLVGICDSEEVDEAIRDQKKLLLELRDQFLSFAAEQGVMMRTILEKINVIEAIVKEQFEDVEDKAAELFPDNDARDKIRRALYIFMAKKFQESVDVAKGKKEPEGNAVVNAVKKAGTFLAGLIPWPLATMVVNLIFNIISMADKYFERQRAKQVSNINLDMILRQLVTEFVGMFSVHVTYIDVNKPGNLERYVATIGSSILYHISLNKVGEKLDALGDAVSNEMIVNHLLVGLLVPPDRSKWFPTKVSTISESAINPNAISGALSSVVSYARESGGDFPGFVDDLVPFAATVLTSLGGGWKLEYATRRANLVRVYEANGTWHHDIYRPTNGKPEIYSYAVLSQAQFEVYLQYCGDKKPTSYSASGNETSKVQQLFDWHQQQREVIEYERQHRLAIESRGKPDNLMKIQGGANWAQTVFRSVLDDTYWGNDRFGGICNTKNKKEQDCLIFEYVMQGNPEGKDEPALKQVINTNIERLKSLANTGYEIKLLNDGSRPVMNDSGQEEGLHYLVVEIKDVSLKNMLKQYKIRRERDRVALKALIKRRLPAPTSAQPATTSTASANPGSRS